MLPKWKENSFVCYLALNLFCQFWLRNIIDPLPSFSSILWMNQNQVLENCFIRELWFPSQLSVVIFLCNSNLTFLWLILFYNPYCTRTFQTRMIVTWNVCSSSWVQLVPDYRWTVTKGMEGFFFFINWVYWLIDCTNFSVHHLSVGRCWTVWVPRPTCSDCIGPPTALSTSIILWCCDSIPRTGEKRIASFRI